MTTHNQARKWWTGLDVPADVVRRHLIINKVCPKGAHLKCQHTNKEVLIELGKLSHFFCEISTVGCFSETPVP